MLSICKDKLLTTEVKKQGYDNNPQNTWLNFITPESNHF